MKGLRQFATRPVDDAIAKRLLDCVTCIEADPSDPASFDAMREQLDKLEAGAQDRRQSPVLSGDATQCLFADQQASSAGPACSTENGAWRRLVVEKPFGTDLASAKALNG